MESRRIFILVRLNGGNLVSSLCETTVWYVLIVILEIV